MRLLRRKLLAMTERSAHVVVGLIFLCGASIIAGAAVPSPEKIRQAREKREAHEHARQEELKQQLISDRRAQLIVLGTSFDLEQEKIGREFEDKKNDEIAEAVIIDSFFQPVLTQVSRCGIEIVSAKAKLNAYYATLSVRWGARYLKEEQQALDILEQCQRSGVVCGSQEASFIKAFQKSRDARKRLLALEIMLLENGVGVPLENKDKEIGFYLKEGEDYIDIPCNDYR